MAERRQPEATVLSVHFEDRCGDTSSRSGPWDIFTDHTDCWKKCWENPENNPTTGQPQPDDDPDECPAL